MEEHPQSFDICIVCALYEEASAVLEEFSARCGITFTKAFRGLNQLEYRHTTIQNRRGESLTVFVTWLSRMGLVRTGLDLAPLLHEVRPRFVAMTGMCAGDRRKVKLGDLIVAIDAYHPEEGKISMGADGQPVRLPETRTEGATTQVVHYVRGFDEWKEPVRGLKRQQLKRTWKATDEPQCHIEVMASSMAVRADNPFPQWTTQHNRKTIGIDMEAATFYAALRDFPLIHGLVVKGVSDYGDRTKTDRYRDYARRASAVYLLHFIQEYVTLETMPRRDTPPSKGRAQPSGVWNIPHRHNPHFTGRDELLAQLDQHLSQEGHDGPTTTRRAALTQPQAIKGLGGIGKTQIAVEYAYRSREQGRYTHILWVNAANEEALITSFVGLADLLPSFSAKSETNQSKLVKAIKRWLEQCQERWLLIFDNVDDLTTIPEYFPHWGNGSILLTTRANAVASIGASLEVETMGFVEGTHLLLRRAHRFDHATDEETNDAGNIVVALDHFPLALDQAGAYIEETQCSFGDYLEIYQNHRAALLARRGTQATNYPDSVATTWSLSFQKVEQANPAAAELLHLCAYLSPDRIPEELITGGAAYWNPLLQQAATDHFTFNQLIEDLLKFSLVKRLVEEHMLSIHRLVQAVQMDMMELEVQHQWAKRVVLAVNEVFPRDSGDPATWSQCLRHLEQAQACDTLIQQHLLVLIEAADLLNRTGNYLRKHASYTIAELLYQRALHIREQALGLEHPDVAASLYKLADLYREQGKYEQAELLFQRALRIQEQALGPVHHQVAFTLNALAALYNQQGKYEQAEPLYQRALHVMEQALGPEHPEIASPLIGLAIRSWQRGKYEQAELLYRRALRIEERALGPEHPQLAYALNNLGILYSEQGKYAEAEPLYLRALYVREQALGPEHPHVAYPLNNLAELYKEQSKYEQAEPLYQRGLHIWEQALGLEHPQVAFTLNGLANLYREQGKYEQAEPLYQRALRIREQVLGPEHPNIAASLNGLANLYREQSKYEQAEPLYQRALRIREQALGAHHPQTAETMRDLAQLREGQGNSEEATVWYARAQAVYEQALGVHHSKTTEARERLRTLLVALGRTEEAAQIDVAQNELAETEEEHEAHYEE